MAILPTGDLFWNTFCEYIGLKSKKNIFIKNAFRNKKKAFYGETKNFREKFYSDDPPFMAIPTMDLF